MLKAYSMLTLLDIVSSKSKAEVLRLLFGVDPREFHLRELARQSKLALRTVQLEMARMVKAGLVTSRRDGNRLYYQANRNSPVYPDLRNLVLKTTGLANVLGTALRQPGVELAFVFGSLAREDARPESDVDLMVIGAIGLRAVTSLLSGVSETLGREINPHVLTREVFAQRQRANDHFISSVLAAPRLFIIGSENELTELGK
jgi:uncharacterized protein